MFFNNLYKRTGRLGLAAVIICLLAIPLSGCGGATPTPEPVTITFACVNSDEAYCEEMIQKFNEQYPYIIVELRPYTRQTQGQVTGDDVDVLITWEGVLQGLYAQGDLLDLRPFIEMDQSLDLDDFHPAAMALFSYGGSTWALPAGLDVDVMYYNQELFDQYNVPYPEMGWTLDDFLNAAIAVRDPDAGSYGYATAEDQNHLDYSDAQFFIRQHGGQIFDDPLEPTRTTFDAPLVIEALEWYADLYHEYDVAPTPKEARRHFASNWPQQAAFFSGIHYGKAGMWRLPFSERGGSYWRFKWYMRWGMVPMPRDTRSVTYPYGEGYAISSNTPYPEASWQWIAFLSKEMPYRLIPARQSFLESKEYEELVGTDLAAVVRACMNNADLTRSAPGAYDAYDGVFDLFPEAIGYIVSEDWTPQEAVDWAQREAEARIGQ